MIGYGIVVMGKKMIVVDGGDWDGWLQLIGYWWMGYVIGYGLYALWIVWVL